MKHKMRLRSALLTALAMLTVLVSCGTEEPVAPVRKPCVPDETIVEFDDKYKNFYEIFVRSFKDSDGNGIGDLNGVAQKLDYLKPASGAYGSSSLGINGIWLMPICPSPSYHKYDITDYMAIDQSYGTMDDFDNLVQKCHEHGITLIIDMVLNHSSSQHEWFKMFCDNLRSLDKKEELKYDEKYTEYYTHYTAEELTELGASLINLDNYTYYSLKGAKFRPIPGTDYYYECSFSDDMPELNFQSEHVWKEIEKICDFWIGKGVDGFRFDAVLYFDYNNTSENVKIMKRIADYCRTKNPGFYTVGEAWTSSPIIREYYKSGFDSFFDFAFANTGGHISKTVKSQNGREYAKKVQNWNNQLKLVSASDAIDAPFVSNHDMYRSSSYFMTLGQRKMAASLYMMMPGNTFIYYGEEIGLKGTSTDGSKKDPTARMPMKWSATDDGTSIANPPGTDTAVNQTQIDGVAEQLRDENSLLNHYRLLLKLKNQNPQIARGTVTACDFGKDSICAYTCVYDGVAVMVIHNLDLEEASFDVGSLGYSDFSELRGYIVAKNAENEKESASAPVFGASSQEETQEEEKDPEATLSGGKLTIPGRTTVVLRSTQHYDDIVINPDSITTSPEDEKVQGMNEE